LQKDKSSVEAKLPMHSQTTGHDKCFMAGWRFALGGAAVHPALPDEKQTMEICPFVPTQLDHGRRKGLVTDVSGPQHNASPGTLNGLWECDLVLHGSFG
jgi:hypothetical protein